MPGRGVYNCIIYIYIYAMRSDMPIMVRLVSSLGSNHVSGTPRAALFGTNRRLTDRFPL